MGASAGPVIRYPNPIGLPETGSRGTMGDMAEPKSFSKRVQLAYLGVTTLLSKK